jgi:hypothetical protein
MNNSLVAHWCSTIPVLFSTMFCTWYTLLQCADDWLLFVLLLPGCIFLWACVAAGMVHLIVETSQKVMNWRVE